MTSRSFNALFCAAVLCFQFSPGRRWKDTHQQPFQTPLCFSATLVKSGQVFGVSSLTVNRSTDSPGADG